MVPGCTDTTATNHDPQATEDDGSCVFEEPASNDTDDTTENDPENETSPNNESSPNNQTDELDENTTGLETGPYVCEGCCGESFEVASERDCPMVDCGPCDEGASTASSSAEDLRSVMVAVVVVLVLLLALAGRRPPRPGPDDAADSFYDEENLS